MVKRWTTGAIAYLMMNELIPQIANLLMHRLHPRRHTQVERRPPQASHTEVNPCSADLNAQLEIH